MRSKERGLPISLDLIYISVGIPQNGVGIAVALWS